MAELRQDPVVDRWVIIAKNRGERPQELVDRAESCARGETCPFCEGHEEQTTLEIAACRTPDSRPNGPGWQVRVVPNKFPALLPEAAAPAAAPGWYRALPAEGVHEVVLESPRHLCSTSELSDDELAEVFWIYRERLRALRRDQRLVQPLIFKNVGGAAGASIEHLHSQLTVLPMVPADTARMLAGAQRFWQTHGRCVYCTMLETELAEQTRIVARQEGQHGCVAFCPFAARTPFETWIVPAEHASHYEELSRDAARQLARIVRDVLARIELALDRPAYNYIIRTAPFDTIGLDHYHWHIEIIPRVTKLAGFEWGSGWYINPVPPEEAASCLRSANATR